MISTAANYFIWNPPVVPPGLEMPGYCHHVAPRLHIQAPLVRHICSVVIEIKFVFYILRLAGGRMVTLFPMRAIFSIMAFSIM